MAKIRRMFPGGNTSQGFYSFHDNIIGENRNMLYIIKGVAGGGKSSLMRDIGSRFIKEGYDLEYHHCPSDPYSVDGLVIPALKVAIIDGTPPHSVDPVYPLIKDKIVDLGRFVDGEKLKEKQEDIVEAKKNNKKAYQKAFSYLRSAGLIYSLIEESNSKLVDSKEINKKTKGLIEEVFSKSKIDLVDGSFKERQLFANAYTPEGFFDYSKFILEDIPHVYYIKGEIGTGKDLILKRILDRARIENYSLEIYHNALMPDKIETLYIKDLDTIISLNNNASQFTKHTLDLDSHMDLYELNNEDYHVLNIVLDKGVEALKSAKKNHMILEESYNKAIDFSGIDEVKEEIYKEIRSICR